jgi:hypothetical protein
MPEQELHKAIGRIGSTPRGRMRWILDFVQTPLHELSEGDQLNQLRDFMAINTTPLVWRMRDGTRQRWKFHGVSRSATFDDLRTAQKEWGRLVDRFRNTPMGGDFEEELPTSSWIVRRGSDGFTLNLRTHSPAPAVGLLMSLLADFGHAIRKCEECGRLYLAARQLQKFCSRRCQNRASFRANQERDAEAKADAEAQAPAAVAMGPTESATQQKAPEESPLRRSRRATKVRPRRRRRAPRGVTGRA